LFYSFIIYIIKKKEKMEDINQLENEIFAYINDKGQEVFTPNFEFANIMAKKYGTLKVFVQKF